MNLLVIVIMIVLGVSIRILLDKGGKNVIEDWSETDRKPNNYRMFEDPKHFDTKQYQLDKANEYQKWKRAGKSDWFAGRQANSIGEQNKKNEKYKK